MYSTPLLPLALVLYIVTQNSIAGRAQQMVQGLWTGMGGGHMFHHINFNLKNPGDIGSQPLSLPGFYLPEVM